MFQEWAKAQSVDGAYWSLMVEMSFYIYVGLAIQFKLIRHAKVIVALWLLVSAINLVLKSYWVDALMIANWGPFFCVGIVCFLLREGDRSGQRDQDRDHAGEDRTIDEDPAHEPFPTAAAGSAATSPTPPVAVFTAIPGWSFCTPSMTTCSPAASPLRTIHSPSSRAPSSMPRV